MKTDNIRIYVVFFFLLHLLANPDKCSDTSIFIFFGFQRKHVIGNQKNGLSETVLLITYNMFFKEINNEILRSKCCLAETEVSSLDILYRIASDVCIADHFNLRRVQRIANIISFEWVRNLYLHLPNKWLGTIVNSYWFSQPSSKFQVIIAIFPIKRM